MISNVFWSVSQKVAFQYVDGWFRVYGEGGDFISEFSSFESALRLMNALEGIKNF